MKYTSSFAAIREHIDTQDLYRTLVERNSDLWYRWRELMSENKSEIAAILQHIDLEMAAMKYLKEFSVGASHAAITARYTALSGYQERLTLHIGEEAAMSAIINSLDRTIK